MSRVRVGIVGALAAASCLAPLGAASAAIIGNGGFADGATPANGTFQTVGVGSGVIPGWDVLSGTVDWIRGYWQSSDGDGYSVDMNGNSPGVIAQTISTTPGAQYRLTFDLSGNPDIGGGVRVLVVDTGGPSTPFTYAFNAPPNGHANMNWAPQSLNFTATGSTTQIRFASGTSGNCCWGAALDNVAISQAVPEPGSWALMILGLLAVGFAARAHWKEDQKLRALEAPVV